ncbi:MAG: hypothetical protein RLZZ28_771 [Bacteroidota bacterium]|jgi:type IX secretion system PorP/SprF family membrane protein
MKKYLHLFVAVLLLNSFVSKAQDYTFSQFYEQPLLRNPALAGLFNGDIRVSMAYRNQWGAITVPYRTSSLSVEHKIPVGKHDDILTIGSQMSMDAAGDIQLKRTQFLPVLNFHKSLNADKDTYLSLAFMGGPVNSQFDASQLKMGDQFVNGSFSASNGTAQPITNNSYSYWDLSTGLCFSSELENKTKFYIAAGLAHFTRPTIRSITTTEANFLSPKLSISIGSNAPIGQRGRLISFADYYTQTGNHQFLGGVLLGMDLTPIDADEPASIYFGSFIRWNDAIIPVIKMDFNHLSIGVSYDVNISRLNVVSNWRGGLELTASYRGFLKTHNSTLDKVRCVRF